MPNVDKTTPPGRAAAYWEFRNSTQEWVLVIDFSVKNELSCTSRFTEAFLIKHTGLNTQPDWDL